MYAPASEYVPQIGSNVRPIAMWLVLSGLCLVFVSIIVTAPFALAGGHAALAATIYRGFGRVCHQLPDRSYFIAGHPLAVCARCTGIYFGFTAATVTYPLFTSLRQTYTPARKWLLIAAALLFIDWSIEFFGIAHNTHSSRFLTGALLGATSVFYVIPGLIELSLRQWKSEPELNQMPVPMRSAPQNHSSSDYSAPHRRI